MFLKIKVAIEGFRGERRSCLEAALGCFPDLFEQVHPSTAADLVVVPEGADLPLSPGLMVKTEWLESPEKIRKAVVSAFCATMPFHEMCCDSRESRAPKAWNNILQSAAMVCNSSSPLLITGETGVGKDVLARKIHEMSSRSKEPFMALNCGAIPPSLVESELLGCERGAYTDAVSRAGVLEQAGSGTLFLDEVGELPLEVQVKLLRVLEDRQLKRVGGNRNIKLGFRLIKATNRDLPTEVRLGRFRQDLFYRLEVLVIKIPPLRHRLDEIPGLVLQFAGSETGRRFTRQAWEKLAAHPWPGNIRELRNVVERAVLLKGSGETVEARHIRFDGLLEFSDPLSLEN